MLHYDILDEAADTYVPNKVHKFLHVNCKDAWLNIMTEALDEGLVKTSYDNIYELASNWENMLYYKFSKLN